MKYISNIPFFALCTSIDSIICSVYFLSSRRKYITYNSNKTTTTTTSTISTTSTTGNQKSGNQNTVTKTGNYLFNVVERYFMYFCLYFLTIHHKYMYVLVLFTIPQIQNKLYVQRYVTNRTVFIKYNMSKMIVSGLQQMHPDIIAIKNYNIFLIYHQLTPSVSWSILKNYLFVMLLYFLKNSQQQSLYYYYKAIKAAYYCETGYLFNTFELQNAISIINYVINEKRWDNIHKLEIINAFYTIINHNKTGSIYDSIYLMYMYFFTIWSSVYCTFVFLNINHNSLIASLFLVTIPLQYLLIKELIFYMANRKNIKKVIDKYNMNGDDFVYI
jgi:hypothetical protein